MGDKGDKNAARPPEGSLVETRCLIKGPKSAIVPFPAPRSGPKSRTGPGALAKSYRGARGVMVIAVGIGHGDTSSNPGRDWLHFT